MKKIEKVRYFNTSRNAEHLHVHCNLLATLTEEFAEANGISALRSAYAENIALEKNLFLLNPAFMDTPLLKKLNTIQTDGYLFLLYAVEAYAKYSLDVEMKECGERIYYEMTPFHNLGSKSYSEKTQSLDKFYTVLEDPDYTQDFETLHLTEALADGKATTQEFNAAYVKRASVYEKTIKNYKMKDVRQFVDDSFKRIADTLDAIYFYKLNIEKNADEAQKLEEVIMSMNGLLIQFNRLVRRRLAYQYNKQKAEEEENPSTENPEESTPQTARTQTKSRARRRK